MNNCIVWQGLGSQSRFSHDLPLSFQDFNPEDAAKFDPTSWDYYKDAVLPSTVPGLVLGCIALVCFIFFIIWIFVQFCHCMCCRKRNKAAAAAEADAASQFIKEEGSYGAAAFGLDQTASASAGRRCTAEKIMQALIIAFTLATIGVSAWGIAASIDYTNEQIPNFWTTVRLVDEKVNSTVSELKTLDTQLETLEVSTATLGNSAPQVAAALTAAGVTDPSTGKAIAKLTDASAVVGDVRSKLGDAISTVESYMGDAIKDIQTDIKPASENFQDNGRYIAIAIMFGLTILAALLAGLFSLRVGHPVWASVFVALLWLCVCLLMLLGVGLLKGLWTVSEDACLYIESYAMRYAQTEVEDPQKREWITNAMTYYFQPTAPVGVEPTGSALKAITGVDIEPLYNVIMSPEVTSFTQAVAGANTSALTTVGLSGNIATAAQNLTTLVQPLTTTLTDLESEASRTEVFPIYQAGKSLICCDAASASNDLFIAWTVVGCLGLVLAALCSWRVITHTFKKKKKMGAAQ